MTSRLTSLKFTLLLLSAILLVRLFYWQVLSADKLAALAQTQRTSTRTIPAQRGRILASDGFALVSNTPSYLAYAYTPDLTTDPATLAQSLAPYLLNPDPDATEAAKPVDQRIREERNDLIDKLTDTTKTWIPLGRNLKPAARDTIAALNLPGIGFDEQKIRFYPEASTSAHLLGFVGRDAAGDPQGYFGLEGYYDLELRGKAGLVRQEKDASGKPIVIGAYSQTAGRTGRDLQLYLNRALQHSVEKHLKEGIKKYGAVSGEVVLMDPSTGAILAMASQPSYDQSSFIDYPTALYKNPAVASAYEPGSTFKVLIMAAALQEGVVTPDTICDDTCNGAVKIDKYTIKTWNDKYYQDETMAEVLAHSDNTGMIFVSRKLGRDKEIEYIKKFGIGQLTGIDLQDEASPTLRDKWNEVDLATASFGQGLATTAIQMVRAVSAIANGGNLVTPRLVHQVIGDQTITIEPQIGPRVISPETAAAMTEMMVTAVEKGDAAWASPKGYKIAGKTGTAQIAVSGHYDTQKTIGSFIGFAPADHPKFVMLVKLTEPSTSQWGSETAAPLWFDIAKDALYILGVAPTQ